MAPEASTAPGAGGQGRIHGLDAARGFSMLLGVFGHSAFAYTTFASYWTVADPSRSPVVDLLLGFVYFFRLPAFFLTSGFFARLVLVKRGARSYASNRALRVVVPLVVLIVPVNVALAAVHKFVTGASYEGAGRIQLHYLWFLYYLALYLAIGLVLSRVNSEVIAKVIDRVLGRLLGSVALPILLGAATGLATYQAGFVLTPLRFRLEPLIFPYLGSFFAFGWMLHRRRDLVERLAESMGRNAVVAITAFPVMTALLITASRGNSAALAPAGVLRGVFAWSMGFAFVGFFIRFFRAPSGTMGYLADASYWTYLVHLPIVLLLQHWAVGLQLSALAKLALVVASSLAVCIASYHVLVRHTPIGWVLNGRRIRV